MYYHFIGAALLVGGILISIFSNWITGQSLVNLGQMARKPKRPWVWKLNHTLMLFVFGGTLATVGLMILTDVDLSGPAYRPVQDAQKIQVTRLRGYLLYVPESAKIKGPVPLVVALSPQARADDMIGVWKQAADKHGWIVVASTVFQNGMPYDTAQTEIEREVSDVQGRFPIDPSRIILAGFSGGAMMAQAFATLRPDLVRVVVANTGKMEEAFIKPDYPEHKIAIFLASPGDFRYDEMKRDRRYLDSRHWATEWLEFAGGHQLASADDYVHAADLITSRW